MSPKIANSRARGGFWGTLTKEQMEGIEAVDMWDLFIASVEPHVTDAAKIVLDKFHVGQHLGEALERVRRKESNTRKAAGDDLSPGRAEWLRSRRAL
jgi:transposase